MGRLLGDGRLGGVLLAFLIAACAVPDPKNEAAPSLADAPSPVAAVKAPEPPLLTLPAPPAERSPEELWRQANRRAQLLEARVAADIASVRPGPLPAPASEPARKPVPARPTPAPTVAPPAPAPPAPPPSRVEAEPRIAVVPSMRVDGRYTVETGLPSNRITAIYVDDADAWIGTADGGLARLNFDESNWIVIQTVDGLASNRVSDIIKYQGRVYVGTQKGLSIWDGVSWTTEATFGKVKLVNTVFQAHDGVLWVAARTMHGGLLTFDGGRWQNRSGIRPGTLLNNVSDFAFSDKTLWIGTTNRGLYRFDGREWTSFTVADGLSSNFVYTLAVKGTACYLGGCCGVSAFEEGSWNIYDIAEGLPHSTVNAVAVDGGLVWFGSKKGLGIYNGIEFVNFYTQDGLTDDRITALFIHGDDVWVGTANGLNRLKKTF